MTDKPGAQLAALRRKVKKTCFCGTEFEGLVQAKFCSHACRQREYRRKKEKL